MPKFKIKIGYQGELWEDVNKNIIKDNYFKSLAPESRISYSEVLKLKKIIDEKINKKKLQFDDVNINSK